MSVCCYQVVEKQHVKEQERAEDMHWAELNDQDRLAKELKCVSVSPRLECAGHCVLPLITATVCYYVSMLV